VINFGDKRKQQALEVFLIGAESSAALALISLGVVVLLPLLPALVVVVLLWVYLHPIFQILIH
jgi:hypothetical protein